jgi:hypothetical protein
VVFPGAAVSPAAPYRRSREEGRRLGPRTVRVS